MVNTINSPLRRYLIVSVAFYKKLSQLGKLFKSDVCQHFSYLDKLSTEMKTKPKNKGGTQRALVSLLLWLIKPWEVLSFTVHRKSTCFLKTRQDFFVLTPLTQGHSRLATPRRHQITPKSLLQPNYPSTLNWQKFM